MESREEQCGLWLHNWGLWDSCHTQGYVSLSKPEPHAYAHTLQSRHTTQQHLHHTTATQSSTTTIRGGKERIPTSEQFLEGWGYNYRAFSFQFGLDAAHISVSKKGKKKITRLKMQCNEGRWGRLLLLQKLPLSFLVEERKLQRVTGISVFSQQVIGPIQRNWPTPARVTRVHQQRDWLNHDYHGRFEFSLGLPAQPRESDKTNCRHNAL